MGTDSPGRPRDVDLTSFLLYNTLVVPAASLAVSLSRFTHDKVREAMGGRRELWSRLEKAAPRLQNAVWVHASSAGEYEQARPVLRGLREQAQARGTTLPTLVTVFSPSGYRHAVERRESDTVDYLPLDTAASARRLVRLIRPRALVFVSFDCWPNVVWAARRAQVPLLLVSGNFHEGSHRLKPIARGFYRRLFDTFSHLGVIGERDAHLFRQDLGVRAPVTITGDTRADQVIHRARNTEDGPLAQALRATGYRYLALASIWPSDEENVLDPALNAVASREDWGLILVPHEPRPQALARLHERAAAAGLTAVHLSDLVEVRTRRVRPGADDDRARWRVILVDTVGMLAEIYHATQVTYVGGSFSTGVHNVLEPSVTGQPVLLGPRHQNAHEASRLIELDAAKVIHDPAQAGAVLDAWLDDESARVDAGRRAQQFVGSQEGATSRTLDLLAPYVFETGPST
jgi:3-deoxy-D-manno-octulosonic-acid transferase